MKCNFLSIYLGVDFISKIGRNDPCKCGSGKKYKKCCMVKDKEERNQITCMCEICSKEMKDSDIYSTVELEEGSPNSTWITVSHLCSYDCNLAFTLHTKLDQNEKACGYMDVESTISSLEDFNEWDEEMIDIAIQNLLINGSSSVKEALTEYLEMKSDYVGNNK